MKVTASFMPFYEKEKDIVENTCVVFTPIEITANRAVVFDRMIWYLSITIFNFTIRFSQCR